MHACIQFPWDNWLPTQLCFKPTVAAAASAFLGYGRCRLSTMGSGRRRPPPPRRPIGKRLNRTLCDEGSRNIGSMRQESFFRWCGKWIRSFEQMGFVIRIGYSESELDIPSPSIQANDNCPVTPKMLRARHLSSAGHLSS